MKSPYCGDEYHLALAGSLRNRTEINPQDRPARGRRGAGLWIALAPVGKFGSNPVSDRSEVWYLRDDRKNRVFGLKVQRKTATRLGLLPPYLFAELDRLKKEVAA